MRALIFLVIMLASQAALSTEHIVWDKAPIELHLSLGNERQVVFPDNIEIGITGSAIDRFKTLTSVDNRMFIEPNSKFDRQRILVRESSTGINYVIYLSVRNDDTQLDPVVTIHKENKIKVTPANQTDSHKNSNNDGLLKSYPYLTRYVAQQLYAPERLIRNNPSIQRISVPNKSFSSLFRCTSGSLSCTSIVATPLVSYKTGQLYASALKIKNVSDYALDIDPRLIKSDMSPGTLLTATTMHGRLLPSRYGDKSETVIIIVHKRPLLAMFLGLN